MTRAGSGAQRSGAPALPLHYFGNANDVYRSRPLVFFFTFNPGPGPFSSGKDVARPASRRPWVRGCGSRVLARDWRRTHKPLICLGSTVLFWSPTRDVCGCACMRTCREFVQNLRTSEPNSRNGRNTSLFAAFPVLCRFSSSGGIKIGGKYPGFAPSLDAVTDLQCLGGAALRNFWARRAAAVVGGGRGLVDRAGLEAGRDQLGAAGRNGGFLRVCAGRIGHVETAMSKRYAQGVGIASLSGDGHKLSRLSAPRRLVLPLGAIEGVGSIVQAEGGGPPTAARPVPCMVAHAIFWISIDLLNHGIDVGPQDRAERSISTAEMGSGECDPLPSDLLDGREALDAGCVARVGDGGGPGCWSPLGERRKLLGGRGHVNA